MVSDHMRILACLLVAVNDFTFVSLKQNAFVRMFFFHPLFGCRSTGDLQLFDLFAIVQFHAVLGRSSRARYTSVNDILWSEKVSIVIHVGSPIMLKLTHHVLDRNVDVRIGEALSQCINIHCWCSIDGQWFGENILVNVRGVQAMTVSAIFLDFWVFL